MPELPPRGDPSAQPGRAAAEPVSFRPLALAPVLAAVLLGWLGLRGANAWLELLACAALGPLAVSYLGRTRLDGIDVHWQGPARCTVGEVVEHRFTVANHGRRAGPPLLLRHELAGFAEVVVAVTALPPGEAAELRVPRLALARAVARRQRITLTTTAPFGLAERTRGVQLPAVAIVHPAGTDPARIDTSAEDGDKVGGRAARSGNEVHATREWRPGDSSRQVHWRSTARRGRLVVVEPERTVAGRMVLVICGPPGDPRWEALVARAAATATAALGRGEELSLLAAPGGPGHRLRTSDPVAALDWFSGLQDGSRRPAEQELRAALEWAGPGADVVVAGPGLQDAELPPAHLGFALDRAAAAAGPAASAGAAAAAVAAGDPRSTAGAARPAVPARRVLTLGPADADRMRPHWTGGGPPEPLRDPP